MSTSVLVWTQKNPFKFPKNDLRCVAATCRGAMCGSKLRCACGTHFCRMICVCAVHFKASDVQPQYRTLFWQ